MRNALALVMTAALGLLQPGAALAGNASGQIAIATTTPLVGRGEPIELTIDGPGDPCSYELTVTYDSNGFLLPVVPLKHMLYVPHSQAGPAQTRDSACTAKSSPRYGVVVLDPPSLMNAPGRYRLAIQKDGAVSNEVTIEIAP